MRDVLRRVAPLWLRKCWWRFREACLMLRELGPAGAVAAAVRLRTAKPGTRIGLKPASSDHLLHARAGSSDFMVFRQIFLEREYGPLLDLANVRLVIDCGANVGYASACFLSRFPGSHVIAVEPDPGNFAMLSDNLRPFGTRAKLLCAGIWSVDSPLKFSRVPYRDGREWSVQVRQCEPGEEPDFQGVSIGRLLADSGFDRISLLKIDIEGAEAVVFRDDVGWLDKVDAIAIELHDDSPFGNATEIFHSAIRGRGFEVSRSGELTICRRPAAGTPPV